MYCLGGWRRGRKHVSSAKLTEFDCVPIKKWLRTLDSIKSKSSNQREGDDGERKSVISQQFSFGCGKKLPATQNVLLSRFSKFSHNGAKR